MSAEEARQERINEVRVAQMRADRLTSEMAHAFTREELGVMFDCLSDDFVGATGPMHVLAYAIGQAWADYDEIRAGEVL
jgi:hypothetical protein